MIQKHVQNVRNHTGKGEKMIIPVRCWSCGKPVGQLWEKFMEKVENGEEMKKALDSLNLGRYCCRSCIMTHINLADTATQFKRF